MSSNDAGAMIRNGGRYNLASAVRISKNMGGSIRKLPIREGFWRLIKLVSLLTGVAFCAFEYILNREAVFHEYAAAILQTQWMLLVCFAVWCGTFLFLTFNLKDLPLIGLLLIAIAANFVGYAKWQGTDIITLLFGVTVGNAARCLLNRSSRRESAPTGGTQPFRRFCHEAPVHFGATRLRITSALGCPRALLQ